ncbi:hypothetical protein LguiB_025023 [Lonicera macranthoides]
MPMLHHSTLFQAIKIFLFFFFLPFILPPLIFTLFTFILLLPILFPFGFSIILYKIVIRYPIKSISLILSNFKSHQSLEGSPEINKQESVDLDGPELPSTDASDEEQEQERRGEKGECRGLRLCRIKTEQKPFHEKMSFWRRIESGDFRRIL